MNFVETAAAQYSYMQRKKAILEKKLKELPEGRLVRKEVGEHTYFYIRKSGKLYSTRQQPEVRKLYEEKQSAEKELKKISRNLPLLGKLLQAYIPLNLEREKRQIQGKEWEETEGQKNPFPADERELQYQGVVYRSKSEMMIAVMLTSFGIEFKYEVEVKRGQHAVYPDFVIRRPKDGKIFYWEHAGVTAKEEYIMKFFGRLDQYHDMGINLWDNLILSFDAPDGSLNADQIEKIIRLFLL